MSCYSLLKGPACGEPGELFWVGVVCKQATTCVEDEPNACKSPPSTSLVLTGGSQMPRPPDFSHVWLRITFLLAGSRHAFWGFC